MREIKKRDENRRADVTVILNDQDDVIGIRLEPFEPVPIIDFNLDRLLMPMVRFSRPPGFPPIPSAMGLPR